MPNQDYNKDQNKKTQPQKPFPQEGSERNTKQTQPQKGNIPNQAKRTGTDVPPISAREGQGNPFKNKNK